MGALFGRLPLDASRKVRAQDRMLMLVSNASSMRWGAAGGDEEQLSGRSRRGILGMLWQMLYASQRSSRERVVRGVSRGIPVLEMVTKIDLSSVYLVLV